MLQPYNFHHGGNDYRFDTDKGIFYSVKFTDGSFYFANLPAYIPVFEVGISIISLGENLSPPRDARVEATVIEIFRIFFLNHENSIVNICDNLDLKQAVRHRKFDMWFHRYAGSELSKFDTHFIVEELEIYASLILHTLNPFKDNLTELFLNQADEYDK